MRTNKQREAILAAVYEMKNHPTADEVYDKLKKDNPRLSLGTVYRNLNVFAQNGDIRRLSIPGAGDRFDFRMDKHEHLLCSKCHRVFDVNVKVSILSKEKDAAIDGYTLTLHGTCGKCR